MADPVSLSLIFLAIASLLILRFRQTNSCRLDHIRGPPSTSWWFGNTQELFVHLPFGFHENQWSKEFGMVYRFKGCFGEDRLMISDPLALRTIMNDDITYVWSTPLKYKSWIMAGQNTIFGVHGDQHRRLRQAINPVFSQSYVQRLMPMIQDKALKMIERWGVPPGDQWTKMDVYPFIHNMTLDSISQTLLHHDMRAGDGPDSTPFAQTYRHLMAVSCKPSSASQIFDAIIPHIPYSVSTLLLPKVVAHLSKSHRENNYRMFRTLLEEEKALGAEARSNDQCLVDIFVNMNIPEKETAEMVSSILAAGQDTSVNALSWALFELAQDSEWQTLIRQEILDVCGGTSGRPVKQGDLDSLTYLNAHIKETLRYYPGLPVAERIATCNTVLPLSEPIVCADGSSIKEILIGKGQFIGLGIGAYHRNTTIWGPDADVFNAKRWLAEEDNVKRQAFGPYANLLSFLGGPHTCIGWRYALNQLQILHVELLRNFVFSISEEDRQSVKGCVAVTLNPGSPVESEKGGLPHMPLSVKIFEPELY